MAVLLEADALSVVLGFVDSLDKTTRTSTSTTLQAGGAFRSVNRKWRESMEDAIARSLPPMPSISLAALLVPGRLRYVLLSCRYHHDEHWVVNAYDALVSRAEAAGLRLREAAEKRRTIDESLMVDKNLARGVAASSSCQQQGSTESQPTSNVDGGSCCYSKRDRDSSCFSCYRIALKRIVGEALRSPAFSWCSTLSQEDSRLLEGCVGASCLLHAMWFSG